MRPIPPNYSGHAAFFQLACRACDWPMRIIGSRCLQRNSLGDVLLGIPCSSYLPCSFYQSRKVEAQVQVGSRKSFLSVGSRAPPSNSTLGTSRTRKHKSKPSSDKQSQLSIVECEKGKAEIGGLEHHPLFKHPESAFHGSSVYHVGTACT